MSHLRMRGSPALMLLTCLILPGSTASAQEPCTDPGDPCVTELLDTFQPYLFFENDGPSGVRIDFPTDFVGADDDTVENNFEHLFSGPAYGVYRNAVRLETAEAPCWLLQYHYYFAANWRSDVWEAGDYTHEHDWEWAYVLAGWSWRLARYIGYAVTLSRHDRDNLDAMARLHTYLYPLIVLDPDDPQDWVRDGRRLTSGAEDPEALLTRAALVFGARGNALAPVPESRDELLEVGLPEWIATPPALWQLGQNGTDCERATDAENCYGDPRVCQLPFVCSGTDECADCGADRYAPWSRSGLWESTCVPSGFRFPQDLRTAVDPEPVTTSPLEIILESQCCHLRWSWQGAHLPAACELVVTAPSSGWRCRLGFVDIDRPHGDCELVILDRPAAAGGSPPAAWLCAPCLWSPQRRGGWLEVWLHDAREAPRLIARTLQPLPGLAAAPVRALQLRSRPQPAVGAVRLQFHLPHAARAALELSDVRGVRLATRDLGSCPAGTQALSWDPHRDGGGHLPAGIYWVRLRACGTVEQTRVCFLR